MNSPLHQYSVVVSGVSLSAATAKTIFQLVTGATRRARLVSITGSFRSSTATDAPAQIRILRQTTAGTASAATINATDSGMPAAISTAQVNATVEPTAGAVLHGQSCPTPGGLFHLPLAHHELVAGVSTRLGVEVTCPQAQTGDFTLVFEE